MKILDNSLSKCLKQEVIAKIITKNKKNEIIGTNGIKNNELIWCPREIQNFKSGEGYELCKEVCEQGAHAEIVAINLAKKNNINIKDSTLYLYGHTYCCDNCLNEIYKNKIKEVYVLDNNGKTIKYYDLLEF